MIEKHTCKICSKKIEQLRRHLTMTHSIALFQYLEEYNCGEEYWLLQDKISVYQKKNSPWSIQFYLSRGLSKEQAELEIKTLLEKRKKVTTFPHTNQHWINKGFSIKEAEQKALDYKKSISTQKTLQELIVWHGERRAIEVWKTRNGKTTRENKRLNTLSETYNTDPKNSLLLRYFERVSPRCDGFICKYSFSDYKSYCRAVKIATYLSILAYRKLLDPSEEKLGRKHAKKGYCLDHKYSKYGGFINKIDPLIISSPQNLQILTLSENTSKGQYCSITKEEVLSYKTILDDETIIENNRNKINEILVKTDTGSRNTGVGLLTIL